VIFFFPSRKKITKKKKSLGKKKCGTPEILSIANNLAEKINK